MSSGNHYNSLGVSSSKEEVHQVVQNLNQGLYPNAFCKIIPDYLSDDPKYCIVMHADGTGTKSSFAYAYWKETGDLSVMKNIPIDAVVMNLDDVICVGAIGPFIIDQTINRNKFNIPAQPLEEIILGTEAYLEKLRNHGVPIYHSGGETADVGDVVQTLIIDSSIVTRMRREDVIDCSNIAPGDVIVGLSSFGQPAVYEEEYNSGMGSNGLTAGRHDLFAKYLAHKMPELYDHKNLDIEKVFTGKYRLDDIDEETGMTMGKLLLSPTRTYAPIVLDFLSIVERSDISGIIHCSGGGQTKCMSKVSNVHIVKDSLFPIPSIFEKIYEAGKISLKEMPETFNLGHRMEVYCRNQGTAVQVINSAQRFKVKAKIIGEVKKCNGKKLTIHYKGQTLEY